MNPVDELLASVGAGEDTLEPWADNLVVQGVEPEPQTAGGLFVPGTAREGAPPIATVVGVGPWLKPENPGEQEIRPGDRIVYERGFETPVELGGRTLLILPGHAVLGILRRGHT